jgi:hypothetical protein
MQSGTYVSGKEKYAAGVKASKGHVTLLVGGNANGDTTDACVWK